MSASGVCLPLVVILLALARVSHALTSDQASFIAHRQLLSLKENDDLPADFEYEIDVTVTFANRRLKRAYVALQTWKKAIYSDPFNTTGNWDGPNVCEYTGVFCAPALDDPSLDVVAGVDLNHADIAGYLPTELGLLTDVALFHVNSNRFCGVIPKSFSKLILMHEFDISNNRFVGGFPKVVLTWPAVKFIDIRYNDFEGKLPPELFLKELDAIFLNNNRFTSTIPDTVGKSTASVVVFAYNKFTGCIPRTIGNMTNLNEIIFLNNHLGGCFPDELGLLENMTIFDASHNSFFGGITTTLTGLKNVEVLEIANNKLTGLVSESICSLPKLINFTFSDNYFNAEDKSCVPSQTEGKFFGDSGNCLPNRPGQKSGMECYPVVSRQVDCSKSCGGDSCLEPPSANTNTSTSSSQGYTGRQPT
ncbi:hypothetical protein MLD38_032096 [Melastoma candidum]|uniref:Uncharacterized protein n=1 Tax=Melastoma candidum TaxID=119954 RepID=A0ACB9M327_9MYRT|nr:hypothetical protein MLD38_032096 [Melastoma candidum]